MDAWLKENGYKAEDFDDDVEDYRQKDFEIDNKDIDKKDEVKYSKVNPSLPIATNDYKLLKKVDKEFEKQNKFIECLFKEYEYGLSKSSELFRVIENHSQQQGEVYCR